MYSASSSSSLQGQSLAPLPLPDLSKNPPSSPPPDSATRTGFSRADLLAAHTMSTQAATPEPKDASRLRTREEYRALTGTRRRNIDNHRTSAETEQSNLPVANEAPKEANKLVDDYSDSEVSEPNSSDEESSDDEFGSADNPKMSSNSRAELEKVISGNKIFTTVHFKKEWEDAKAEEDRYVKEHRLDKYGFDLVAGAANQLVSFGVAGVTATLTGNIWLFPVVAMLTCDLIGDRLAQVIRRSTIVADASKTHFQNQRYFARELGELVEACCNRKPKKKFTISVTDPDTAEVTKVKMTAHEALKHAGCSAGLTAWGQNLLIRGLPFAWFSALYGPRDYYMNYRCEDFFFPNATAMQQPNFTLPQECPSPEHIDPDALRWAMVLIGGMMAGALTTVTNQLVGSCFPHEEKTNYGRETFRKEVIYKESAKLDAKAYLDWLGQQENPDPDEIKSAHTLMRLYDKELRVARKKTSLRKTFQGELDLATQKHRDETMISPEFGSKRLELFFNALGRGITLLAFCYVASRFNVRQSEEEQDKIMGLILIPFCLIIVGGYMWKDDARVVGMAPYGLVKGAMRACKGKSRQEEGRGNDEQDDATTTTAMPQVVVDGDAESDSARESKNSPDKSPGKSEKIASTSDTPARTPLKNAALNSVLLPEESSEEVKKSGSLESSEYV